VKDRRRVIPEISEIADWRMQKLNLWKVLKEKKVKDQEVSQLLRVSRATLYRWQDQLKENGAKGLENKNRRPHKVHKSLWWGTELMDAVMDLRVQYPSWGKDKLVILLRRQGIKASSSTVGRILTDMIRLGVLRKASGVSVKKKKQAQKRLYAIQNSQDYDAQRPGDLIEVDTMDVRPFEGKNIKHFTAQDVISRWDVLEIHHKATKYTATAFLNTLISRMPFKIHAIQVDGGKEYIGEFELACKRLGIKLFVLPPLSPKLNGQVERAHRTHLDEFYAVIAKRGKPKELEGDLYHWEYIYNHIRPHQALGYLTPAEYLEKYFHAFIRKTSLDVENGDNNFC